jgi:hypothetical protein
MQLQLLVLLLLQFICFVSMYEAATSGCFSFDLAINIYQNLKVLCISAIILEVADAFTSSYNNIILPFTYIASEHSSLLLYGFNECFRRLR